MIYLPSSAAWSCRLFLLGVLLVCLHPACTLDLSTSPPWMPAWPVSSSLCGLVHSPVHRQVHSPAYRQTAAGRPPEQLLRPGGVS